MKVENTSSHSSSSSVKAKTKISLRPSPIERTDFYTQHAISVATRRTYASAVKQFNTFSQAISPQRITPINVNTVLRWFTALADSRTVAASTIASYRSALSTEYIERAQRFSYDSQTLNPLNDDRVTRLIEGVKNVLADRDQLQRTRRVVTTSLTVELLASVITAAPHNIEGLRMSAAASLGVAAGSRPSELLGSYDYAERAPTLKQITFYSDPAGKHEVQNINTYTPFPIGVAAPTTVPIIPDHFTFELLASKTMKRGETSVSPIGQPLAVAAMWAWLGARGYDTNVSDALWYHPCLGKCTTPKLIEQIKAALASINIVVPLTGRCFRRGAASTLAAQGAPVFDISVAGRWSPAGNVHARYVDPASARARTLLVNRSMGMAVQA